MVDFQSRDTRRTLSDDDDDDDDDRDETTDVDGTETESDASSDANGTGDDAGAVRQSGSATDQFDPGTVTYAVVTVADGRSLDDDPSGDTVVDVIEDTGDAVATRELLEPSYDGVQSAVDALAGREDVDAIVTVGGTGVEPTDVTVDAVEPLMDKHLPGFGELFRVLSHDREGTAIVRTRATAGLLDDVPVFCLPGDPENARLGVERIVVEEADELAAEAATGTDEEA